jgi:uncharacterized protein (TIGR00162 family)
MKKAIIREKKVKLKDPILIEGMPGLGYVGKIVATYLIKKFEMKKFAELYSPFFPYHIIVKKDGTARLLRSEFYLWKSPVEVKNDLIILTGDGQAQTIDGQYDLASKVIKFAEKHNIRTIITIGGYQAPPTNGKEVLVVASNRELLEKIKNFGADSCPGVPIVGTVGLIVGMAKIKKIDAICLLGRTLGYMPDPTAAKNVLKILKQIINLSVDETELDKQIEKSKIFWKKMETIKEKIVDLEKERKKVEEEKITYIT